MLPIGYDTGVKLKAALKNLPDQASEKIKDEWFEEDGKIIEEKVDKALKKLIL